MTAVAKSGLVGQLHPIPEPGAVTSPLLFEQPGALQRRPRNAYAGPQTATAS
jgi:hypothetical protein